MQLKTTKRYHYVSIRMTKVLTTPNAGEDGSSKNSHSLTVGMQNGAATLQDSLAVSYKTKYTLTIQSSNHTSWYITK